jgi:hypothetical protein
MDLNGVDLNEISVDDKITNNNNWTSDHEYILIEWADKAMC